MAGIIQSYAYVPTSGPCYETPLDLRVPLHWSSVLFWDAEYSGTYSAEVEEAECATYRELKPFGISVDLATISDVPHIPDNRCPSKDFFHVKIEDGTKWDIWKDIQGTVFKTITKHFAHLEGFGNPIIRWNVSSDDPYLDEDMGYMFGDSSVPQRPLTSSAPNTKNFTETEAYIPTAGPPYESPLDLRFPLHWDTTASTKCVEYEGYFPHELLSPGILAEKAARHDLWNYIFHPGKLSLSRCIADHIKHYPEGISAPYYEIPIDAPEAWNMDIHEFVMMTIEKCFGQLEGYEKPIIRYVVAREEEEDDDHDDWAADMFD